MPVSADQAREIAKLYLELSHQLGTFRFGNWGRLTAGERRRIEDAEWDLLNYSNSFVTVAVGIVLQDMEKDLAAIEDATKRARKVVQTINDVKAVINVVTSIVTLGGAIMSGNPSAIAKAAVDAVKAAKKVLGS